MQKGRFSNRKESSMPSFNDGLKAFGFYGENYIIEAEEREVIKHHHLKASKETI